MPAALPTRWHTAQADMRMRAMGESATLITSAPLSAKKVRPGQELVRTEAARGMHLDADDECPARELVGKLCRRLDRGLRLERRGCDHRRPRRFERGVRGSASSATPIAAMCCGVVPQQPPMMAAPTSAKVAAHSAKYAGVAG